MAKDWHYQLEFKVRDYECDLQGHVNNSVYQKYLEHTRHEFLLELGVSFSELASRGIMSVVARVDLSYKTPLCSKDIFISKLRVEDHGFKQIFYQDIYRASDNKLSLRGKITTAVSKDGKLIVFDEINDALKIYLEDRCDS